MAARRACFPRDGRLERAQLRRIVVVQIGRLGCELRLDASSSGAAERHRAVGIARVSRADRADWPMLAAEFVHLVDDFAEAPRFFAGRRRSSRVAKPVAGARRRGGRCLVGRCSVCDSARRLRAGRRARRAAVGSRRGGAACAAGRRKGRSGRAAAAAAAVGAGRCGGRRFGCGARGGVAGSATIAARRGSGALGAPALGLGFDLADRVFEREPFLGDSASESGGSMPRSCVTSAERARS